MDWSSGKVSRADFLFILDESVSMGAVIGQINDGFASLNGQIFPNDTLMAVTNMAPAKLAADGSIFLNDPYVSGLGNQMSDSPGFIKLVDSGGISFYRESIVNKPDILNRFKMNGCSAWFTPQQKNNTGDYCLAAHTQINLLPTYIEAGITTLFQLTTVSSLNQKRLFRQGATVNVIFVSDTHDYGKSGSLKYYGENGAYSQRHSYQSVRETILSNSPGLESLKFNGIVPLPPVGDPKLDGLNVIGHVPLTQDEADYNSENNSREMEYSYLPLIKGSNGYATHFTSSDWSTTLSNMISSVSMAEYPTIVLDHSTIEIISVRLDGLVLGPNEFEVSEDKRTLKVLKSVEQGKTVRIQVEYK